MEIREGSRKNSLLGVHESMLQSHPEVQFTALLNVTQPKIINHKYTIQ